MIWQNTLKYLGVLGVSALLSVACTATDPEAAPGEEAAQGSICERAAAHVSSCLQESIATDTGCDPQDAQALLDQSCDALRRQTAGGKEDGTCNPLFFWRECNRGISINVAVSYEERNLLDWSDGITTQDSCFTFQIRDSAGHVVVKETTRGSGHLMSERLADGDYTIELLNRDGSVVELMDTPGTLTGMDLSNDLDARFTVSGGRSDSHTLYLPVRKEHAESFHQCGSLTTRVQLFCGGEVYQDDAARWDWYATITPVSEGAWVRAEEEYEQPPYLLSSTSGSYLRDLYNRTMDLDVFRKRVTIYQLSPGTFDITYYYISHDRGRSYNEMSFAEEAFRKFVLGNGYMSGHSETHTVELEAHDFVSSFGSAQVDVDLTYPSACPR